MLTTALENKLLAALPPQELARLTATMTTVTFNEKDVVYRAGGLIDHVYFPRSGVLSAIVIMLDGSTAEVAAIGSEGMVGMSAFLGATHSHEEVVCQIPTAECLRMPANEFASEVARDGHLRQLIYRYARSALFASARYTACNRLHPVDQRCARWLLMSQDRVGGDEFFLTQEFLSTMLGVRRATVTVSAGKLQAARLITYRYGRVKILDRAGLEKVACECYQVLRDTFTQLSV